MLKFDEGSSIMPDRKDMVSGDGTDWLFAKHEASCHVKMGLVLDSSVWKTSFKTLPIVFQTDSFVLFFFSDRETLIEPISGKVHLILLFIYAPRLQK